MIRLLATAVTAVWIGAGAAAVAHGQSTPTDPQPKTGGLLSVVYADGDTVSLRHTGTSSDRYRDATGVCESYGARPVSQGTTIAGEAVTLHVTCDRPVR